MHRRAVKVRIVTFIGDCTDITETVTAFRRLPFAHQTLACVRFALEFHTGFRVDVQVPLVVDRYNWRLAPLPGHVSNSLLSACARIQGVAGFDEDSVIARPDLSQFPSNDCCRRYNGRQICRLADYAKSASSRRAYPDLFLAVLRPSKIPLTSAASCTYVSVPSLPRGSLSRFDCRPSPASNRSRRRQPSLMLFVC